MLSLALRERRVFLVELLPPRTRRVEDFIERAWRQWSPLIDAYSLVDMPLARRRVSPWAVGRLLQDRGMEVLVHFNRTSRNLPRIVGDALGCSVLGLDNLLLLSGDQPDGGDYPGASRVEDVSLEGQIELLRGLEKQTGALTLGAVFDPGRDRELLRARAKLRAGADFIISQPVFEAERIRALGNILPLDRVIVSLACFNSSDQLRRFTRVPGIEPPCDFQALEGADDSTVEAYTYQRCRRIVEELHSIVLGFCVSGMVKNERHIAELAELAKQDRKPELESGESKPAAAPAGP